MHYQKHSPSTTPATPEANPKGRYRFDTLDWTAAIFVIAVPVFIACRLFWN